MQHPGICKIPKSSTSQNCKQYTSKKSKKIKRFQHVSDCTWKHKVINKLCPKIYDKIDIMCQEKIERMQPFIPLALTFTLSKFKLESKGLARVLNDMGNFRVTINEQGEPTTSIRWAGWVWPTITSHFKSPYKLSSISKVFRYHTWYFFLSFIPKCWKMCGDRKKL